MPQSLARIYLHLVFSTKHREPLIDPEIEPELHACLVAILDRLGCPSLRINGMADHIHALVRLSRRISVADLVQEVKVGSSHWIHSKGERYASFHWQAGYGAFSLGASDLDKAIAYIANQKEHHRARSFQEEYRMILGKYGIDFDERYVWD